MKKLMLSVLLVMFVFQGLQAQRRNGLIKHRSDNKGFITLSTGPAYCFGDPYSSPFEKSFINGTNGEVALGFSNMFPTNFGYKATLHYANFSGSDKLGEKQHSIGYYSYKSNVFEFTARGEYAYYFGRKYRHFVPNSVRGFLGLGVLNSMATFPSGIVGKTAATIAFAIPYGIAYQYDIQNSNFSVGAEFEGQYVFSDYVDGYKPVFITSNDVLTSFKVTLGYRIF